MDDITERLRDVAKSSPIGWDLMPKAADEIDRLRAERDALRELLREALRYPHKPGSPNSTWDTRAFAALEGPK
jgi:hypothetical protein